MPRARITSPVSLYNFGPGVSSARPMNPANFVASEASSGVHRSVTRTVDGLSGRHSFHAPPQPLEEDEDGGSEGWRRRQSTSCCSRLGLRATGLDQHAVMLAASARRLSAAAPSSSSSMRASQLAAALNPQVRARRVGRGWISSDDSPVLYWWRWWRAEMLMRFYYFLFWCLVAEVDARQEQEGDGAGGQGMECAPGGRPRHRLRRPQRQAPHPASKGTA